MGGGQPIGVAVVLLACGFSLLWIALDGAGSGTDTIHQYTAFEADHDGDELLLSNTETGERWRASSQNVDDRIACLPSVTAECQFHRQAKESEIDVSGLPDQRYLYYDGTFYRIAETESFEYEYDRTAPDSLATGTGSLTEDDRAVISDGQIMTTRRSPNANRLVAHEGSYYTILETGQKTYADGGTACSSAGDGFCDAADSYRWELRLRSGGLGLLGLLALGIGTRRVWRAGEVDR